MSRPSGPDRLDVVAELAAHQANLDPPPAAGGAALIALPLAPICALLAEGCFAERRARQVASLAEELGGGDGPLPVIEPTGALSTQLARLWETGVRALFVHGAADQPGLARALRYRWPGGLHLVGDGGQGALHRGEPVAWLGEGVVRVAPGAPIPGGASAVLAAVDDRGDPRALRESGARPFAADPQRRLGVWSGALPPRGALGSEAGAHLRAIWQAHWAAVGQPELVRLAALGLDPALEDHLREPAGPAPPRRARIVAITGIDGSGKSTHAALAGRRLREAGARARIVKLYRQGAFLELADELGARTRRGAPLAAFRASRVVKLVDSLRVYRDEIEPGLAACDALVMDRYVETHIAAAGSQLGWELSAHPALAPFPPADARFWLAIEPERGLARRSARGGRASADEHPIGMAGYAREFARLAAGPGEIRLDAAAPVDENALAIAGRALPLIRGAAGPAELTAAEPAPPRRAGPRCVLTLGRPEPGAAELGAEVASLRGALAAWCGRAAQGVPESFWLEAYAAQLLLDLRTGAPARAWAALWPAALAAMPDHGDLVVLGEIARMIAPAVDIAGYEPEPAAYRAAFAGLGASGAAAERLARDYAVALDRLAAAAGWPALRRASSAAPSAVLS